ncbi:hypothetical protein UAY_00806 [Enterococcus moraviensis ATCC BAA-383]|uniref:Uncharacterized protein n=1 Tax=Enterococcus moraviensis ATCC BAA-383 TaxID=1158609 RepID=R2TDK2_9ENTE|nr:DUF916 and DUF3324 domain-containing protein [Enterococcus moraviensis]EOI03059.1 hypothetical protein UAY_00806 [Enterococcus moraviensis ATCC BAA-383]EOT74064.1 hypothetical protein I586_01060 [Enterococcus moraviensis ATCC BAA-383]OJG67245.1 hypothetical protein RV09_GL002811 [Enterococcus moraviensis]
MRKLNKCILCLVTLCFFLFLRNDVYAFASTEPGGTGAAFSVEAVYPENQQRGESGYYDLKVTPGSKQVIKAKVKNYSDHPIEVFIDVTRGTTSDGGVISYKEVDKEKDSSMLTDIKKLVQVKEPVVKLEAKESKEIIAEINIPEAPYEGQLLGGLHFSEKYQSSEKDREKAVINTFSYSLPIILTESGTKAENKLDLIKAEAGQRNFHNFIEAILQNQAPSIIHKMTIEGKVIAKKTNKQVYSRKEDTFQMAPNSTVKFGFDMKDTEMVAGDYEVVMNVTADTQHYELKKEFTITKEEAKKFNDESVYLEKEETNTLVWLVLGIAGMLIVFILAIIILRKRKKRKQLQKKVAARRIKNKKNKKRSKNKS